MARTVLDNMTSRLERLMVEAHPANRDLNVAIVYEDEASQMWAADTNERISSRAAGGVSSTWWKLGELYHPGVLAGAVSKAMRADLILVATRGTEGLPLPFYFWVNSWLPHRRQGTGALVALLGAGARTRSRGRLRSYLKNLARQSRMELLVEEREG